MKKLIAGLLLVSLFLAACSSKPEKERFTDATVEVTCMIFESGDLLDPGLEQKTKDIFKKHGFDVDDEEAMTAIAEKYQNDPDVQKAVEAALQECAGDLLDAFGDLEFDESAGAGDGEVTDGPTTEEEIPATEEEPAV